MSATNHGDAMAHLLGLTTTDTTTDTTPDPEVTDPGATEGADARRQRSALLTAHLCNVANITPDRARAERLRLFRLSRPQLQSRAEDPRLIPSDRAAALWELRRRAAKRAGEPFPPDETASESWNPPAPPVRVHSAIPVPPGVPADLPAPVDVIDAAGNAAPVAAAPLRNGVSLAANVDAWTRYGAVDRKGKNRAGWHLEAVRDALRQRVADLDPRDDSVSSTRLLLAMGADGALQASYVMRDGSRSEPMPVTDWARAQLAQRMMPAHALGLLKDAARLQVDGRPIGAQLASGLWNAYAHGRTVDGLQVRTVRGADDRRHVRAFLSSTYNVYDCLTMADDLLSGFGADADLWRVIAYRSDEAEARVSMVGGTPEALETWNSNAIDRPIPIIRWGDAEGGQGSAFLEGGTWTTWCRNTMGAFAGQGLHRFRHAGGTSETIRAKVVGAVEDCLTHASGAVRMYDQALETTASDILAWFDERFGAELQQGQRAQLETIVTTEPTVHGGTKLLGGVVDGLTFLGHEIGDMREGERVERLAGRVMAAGLNAAVDGRIPLTVPA